jgi:hypothetical protein
MQHATKSPEAMRMFVLALRLRAKNISLEEAERLIFREYPGKANRDKYMRPRVKRLFLSPGAEFANAVAVYESGGHINDILSVVPTFTSRGAPKGNLNATGKRKKDVLPRLIALWRATSPEERGQFLREVTGDRNVT